MNWIPIIVLIVLFDFVIAALVLWGAVSYSWGPLKRLYPAVDCASDAVRRQFQSFRVSWMNYGFCIHVAVDESYLHLKPATLIRWVGAKPLSIPWNVIEVKKRSKFGPWMTVKIGSVEMSGPAWCLSLANPEQNETESPAR